MYCLFIFLIVSGLNTLRYLICYLNPYDLIVKSVVYILLFHLKSKISAALYSKTPYNQALKLKYNPEG